MVNNAFFDPTTVTTLFPLYRDQRELYQALASEVAHIWILSGAHAPKIWSTRVSPESGGFSRRRTGRFFGS